MHNQHKQRHSSLAGNLIRFYTIVLGLLLTSSQPAQANAIPDPLKPWQAWVLEKHPQQSCPYLADLKARACVWYQTLNIDAQPQSLRFTLPVTLYAESWVNLPGEPGLWPVAVTQQKTGGPQTTAAVIPHKKTPGVRLPAGDWVLRGQIRWKQLPASLKIPEAVGTVTVVVNGTPVPRPYIDGKNNLWFQQTVTKQANNHLQLQVYRILTDTVPAELTTHVDIDIAGAQREVNLGEILPKPFSPIAISSELPTTFNESGELLIQAKTGRWQLNITARAKQPISQLGLPKSASPWPEQEVWAVQTQPHLRHISISGAPSVDPQQYQLPGHLHHLPAYLMSPNQTLTLTEEPTSADKTMSQWRLDRTLWLGFNGNGYTFRDQLFETESHQRRLTMLAPYQLGRVLENQQPRLITDLNGNTGVELRNTPSELLAEGHIDFARTLPTTGWQTAINTMQLRLNLPPAWSLLAVSGADHVSDSWLSNWTIWHLFLLMIITLAVRKTLGIKTATLALATLLVTYQRPDSPAFIWLALIAGLALVNVTRGKLHTWLQRYMTLSLIALLLMLIPFSIKQVQQAIYPQLERPYTQLGYEDAAASANGPRAQFEAQAADADDLRSQVMPSSSALVERKLMATNQAPRPMKEPEIKQVQTGPGIPTWHWRSVSLNWNGPVSETEELTLYLSPPWLSRLGNIVAVLLCWLLALQFVRGTYPQWKIPLPQPAKPSMHNTVASVIIGALLVAIPIASPKADVVIDSELLKQLEERLTQPPSCAPDCAGMERVDIYLDDENATLVITANAATETALALPRSTAEWQSQSITLNEHAAETLKQGDKRWVKLPQGKHKIAITGSLKDLYQIDWSFSTPVSNVYLHGTGWELSGVKNHFAANGNIVVNRLAKQTTDESLRTRALPVYAVVTRQLSVGKDWRVNTSVTRVAPVNTALTLTIPLLSQEQVTTPNVTVTDTNVVVTMAPNQQRISWSSVLPAETITVTAPPTEQWMEVWQLTITDSWHISHTGITPINNNQKDHYQWNPWPGESVTISAIKPDGAAGNSLTIETLKVQRSLGQRMSNTRLVASVRSSIGQPLTINLPPNSELESLQINQQQQPLPTVKSQQLTLPISPGEQAIEVKWKTLQGINVIDGAEPVSLSHPATNISQHLQLPGDRWIVAVGGPMVGPAILVWGAIAVIFVVAIGLGKIKLGPLSTLQWVLLGLGLSTTSLFTPLLMVAMFAALSWRGKLAELPSPTHFKLLQLGLCLLSALAIVTLIAAVPISLLSSPDMHIVGNGSSTYQLNWYQDEVTGTLPSPWVLSLPLWGYKLIMLAWSIWLASALLRWLPWMWQQLNHQQLWPEAKQAPSKETEI